MANKEVVRGKSKLKNILIITFLILLSILFLAPIIIIVMNSFKGNLFISAEGPFALPNGDSFVGFSNYIRGVSKTKFLSAFGWSLFITVFSVGVIVLGSAMTGWYIVRLKTRLTNWLYYLFVFSMIVPFQMVMFTMSKVANVLYLDNPVGLIVIYLGFGSGL